MNNRKPYAGYELTKDYLKKLGVEYVSTDGKEIIVHGKVVKPIPSKNSKKGNRYYYNVRLTDPETGEKIDTGIHVLNFVWNSGKSKPAGKVVDHKNNDAENNDITNLQCITPRENLAKDRDNWYRYELKCNLNKPRSFYEIKLEGYEMAYEQAKKDRDADAAHKLRGNISQIRARLRYYDSHIEEALEIKKIKEEEEACKREYHERAQQKRELKAKVDSARKYYKEIREAYGPDDEYVKKLWGEWKLAIAELYEFKSKGNENLQLN
jgi:hypothetical protein